MQFTTVCIINFLGLFFCKKLATIYMDFNSEGFQFYGRIPYFILKDFAVKGLPYILLGYMGS